MGMATQVKPGAELAAAVAAAKDMGIAFELIDREIRATLLRAWRMTSFWKKSTLAASLMAGFFSGEEHELNEEAMRKLRQQDALSGMLEEMGDAQPAIKRVLVDERDSFMAQAIQKAAASGERSKIVAVVGAAHVPGISRILEGSTEALLSLEELSVIPAKSLFSRIVPWLIPSIVIALFVVGFFYGDTEKVKEAALAWVLANGVLAALGTLLAGGHPLTILAGFVAAPITSLNPTIGAGFVTGFVQTWLRPPSVADMENVGDDIMQLKGWWTNNLARVFLVFMLSSIGSSIGTFAAFGWLKDLVQF
jgi:pheromone shutdown-related protein TraB